MEARPLSLSRRYTIAITSALSAWAGPVKYGRDDCLLGLANIILEVEGKDLAARYRKRYRSRNGAIRVLGRAGVAGAVARGARKLGMAPSPPSRCKTGSLGLIPGPEGLSGAMRHGPLWVSRGPLGFVAVPSERVLKAWGRP